MPRPRRVMFNNAQAGTRMAHERAVCGRMVALQPPAFPADAQLDSSDQQGVRNPAEHGRRKIANVLAHSKMAARLFSRRPTRRSLSLAARAGRPGRRHRALGTRSARDGRRPRSRSAALEPGGALRPPPFSCPAEMTDRPKCVLRLYRSAAGWLLLHAERASPSCQPEPSNCAAASATWIRVALHVREAQGRRFPTIPPAAGRRCTRDAARFRCSRPQTGRRTGAPGLKPRSHRRRRAA